VDRQYNQVRLKGAGEKRVDWQPWRLKKVEVYEQEQRELRAGDLVRFTSRSWKASKQASFSELLDDPVSGRVS